MTTPSSNLSGVSPIGEAHAVAARRRRQSAYYEGAKLSEEAQAAWNREVAGHYVFNTETQVIVRGPFEALSQAQDVADAEAFATWGVTSK